ncbi:protein-disulfide reductase DsbD [Sulfurovum sp.]|uniref:protein-disulfide reductase DsbD n=1 Tax=Sulfurovum sp. TaxID=1969726 RepID=UPI002867E4EB|nr:protein-disulfide reductase DsbD [Sulfurovum sp.]
MNNFVKKLLLAVMLFSTLLTAGFESAIKKQKFLSPEEAFQVSAVLNSDVIETKIAIGDKIHVYDDDTLHYRIISPKILELTVNKPASHDFDGDMVFEKELLVNIPVKDIESQVKGPYTLEIELLGCSDAGICYQPVKKSFNFKGAKLGTFDKISQLVQEGNAAKIVDVLVNESSLFVLFIFFVFGLLLSLTPCIFPMIPILSSIIVSQQSGDTKPTVAQAFFTSLVYVLSMALTYTIVGLIAGLLGADLQAAMQNPWILTIFSGVFVVLALSLFGYFEIGLPASWQSKLTKASDSAQGKGGIIGTVVMGALSALIVGPCTAAPISGAVIFISHTGDALLGGSALFVMSMGMGMPLLLVGLGAGKFMPRPGGWMTRVSQVFGVMMLALAIFMLSRILPSGFTMTLWALLFMGTAIYMDVFGHKEHEGAMRLFRLLALTFLLYGASLFIGAISGSTSFIRPFEKFTTGVAVATSHAVNDKKDHLGYSVERLMKEVKASDKPVVVDFGKDSCTACIELEEITFPDARVQEHLKRFTFIKIDLTANNDDDKALLKEYELFGTPNIIFFGKDNKYMPEKSLTGFIPPEDFAKHLEGIK